MRRKLTKEIINQRLEERRFRLIGEYEGAEIKALFECPKGHQWETTPKHLMGGGGCRLCSKTNATRYTKDSLNKSIRNREIELIGDFVNVKTKSLFRCSFGHEWETNPDAIIQGKGCPHCYGNIKLIVVAKYFCPQF